MINDQPILFDEVGRIEIDDAIQAARPLAFYEADLPDLPLTRLRDRTFEMLAHALAEVEIAAKPGRYTKATLLREGADEGRDVLFLNGERVIGIIQCKRYSSTIALPMVLQELMRFALRAIRMPELVPDANGFSYTFWTAGEITGEAQRFFDAPQTYLESNRPHMLELARKARVGVVALRADNERVASGENEAALDLVTKFDITTLGPVAIKSLLADHDRVRRRFFRGPNDQPLRARAEDVERLMAGFRREQAAQRRRDKPYVRRATIEREFEAFMDSPAQIFAIIGASGRGKSAWTTYALDNPPPAICVDVVRGEDIRAEDANVADTIGRLLRSRRLGEVTATDLMQGVLEWLDDATRLIIIDGIDRVPIAVMSILHSWLSGTLSLAERGPTRIVVTSRPTAWSTVAPDLTIDRGLFHRLDADQAMTLPVLALGVLSPDEVEAFYLAYGLPKPSPQSRPFRIPGLIEREARIRAGGGPRLGTRTAVMAQSLADLGRELQRNAQVGTQQFARLLEAIGDELIIAQDGRLSARSVRNRAPDILRVLDAAIAADLAITDGDDIRIEPDDLVEYLMALRLDPAGARLLLDERGGDFLIGATAMAVALLEKDDQKEVPRAISLLTTGASFDSAALAAAARAVIELKDTGLIREQLGALLSAWRWPNLFLKLSPLVSLLDEVELPAIERLEFALELAAGEDTWDWRGKYFYDADQADSRFITGFGQTAARAIADDPQGAIRLLLNIVDKQPDEQDTVASGLLYLAIKGAPEHAAQLAWERRVTDKRWLLDRVTHVEPEAIAVLLGEISAPDPGIVEAMERLWSLTYEPPAENPDGLVLRGIVARSATKLLPFAESPDSIVKLLVAKLLAEHNNEDEAQLTGLWIHVTDDVFWLALRVRQRDRLNLFAGMVGGGRPGISRDWLLRSMPVDLFSVGEWTQVSIILETAVASGLGHAAALALETLLYRAEALGELSALMPLARQFASSDDAAVRRTMTYFAGSPAKKRRPQTIGMIDEILGLLVEYEKGDNLDTLVWKLLQSAPERPSATARLIKLCSRCGINAVDQALGRWRIEAQGFQILRSEWFKLPKTLRPDLKAFRRRA